MLHALLLIYRLKNSSRCQHAELYDELAPAFAAVSGLLSKMRLENAATGRYGSFYVFETKAAFDAFVASELFATVWWHPSLGNLMAMDFSINPGLAAITTKGRR